MSADRLSKDYALRYASRREILCAAGKLPFMTTECACYYHHRKFNLLCRRLDATHSLTIYQLLTFRFDYMKYD